MPCNTLQGGRVEDNPNKMKIPRLLPAAVCLLPLPFVPLLLAAAQPRIYTYDLPHEFTQGIAEMPLDRPEQQWTTWYDTDQVRSNHPRATEDNPSTLKCPLHLKHLESPRMSRFHSTLLKYSPEGEEPQIKSWPKMA